MTKLSKKDVEHVAKLANLKLNSKEITKYREQLLKVLSYLEDLNEVKTDGIEPTSQTTGLTNVKRLDQVKPEFSLSQPEALSGTNKTHNGYFLVPAILEKDK